MNLKQVNIQDVPDRTRWYKPGRLQKILFQFMESNMECAEVELGREELEKENAMLKLANNLRIAIKRDKVPCACLYRKDRVFLVRNKE